MLITKSSIKPFSTELPVECEEVIKKLVNETPNAADFCRHLNTLVDLCGQTGKVEMARYFEVLNRCDAVLRVAISPSSCGRGLYIDVSDHLDDLVIAVLKFTAALFENSFSRSVYNSFAELIQLLDTCKTKVLIYALRVMVAISKTSRYISQHVDAAHQKLMNSKLTAMTQVCPETAYGSLMSVIDQTQPPPDHNQITVRVGKKNRTLKLEKTKSFLEYKAELFGMLQFCASEAIDCSDKSQIISKLRFFYSYDDQRTRIECIISKLMAISSLFYSRCLLDDWGVNCILTEGLVEEVCSLVQINTHNYDSQLKSPLDTLRTEALKALASIVFLEKPRKLQLVVDTLGFNSFLGYGATLVREVVSTLKKEGGLTESPEFVTALLSLIYHIAGFDYAGNALVSVSTIPTLLEVVELTSLPDTHLSFATRAVRIIDILTSVNFTEFNNHDGHQVVIRRLVHEVNRCQHFIDGHRKSNGQKFVIHHYRSALIKSLLNFMKRAIVDSTYGNHVRSIMEGDLPQALVRIIKNPQFFGPSLLYCALDLPTVFIFQEPAQLNVLQDQGLCLAIIDLFFNDEFTISREIVSSLPNICSALCLNERGLSAFTEKQPLRRIMQLIFSAKFIQTLKKRKNELIDVANQLGTTFDELMRHQPTLRKPLITALTAVMKEVYEFSQNPEVSHVPSLPQKSNESKKQDKTEKADVSPESLQMTQFEDTVRQWGETPIIDDTQANTSKSELMVVSIKNTKDCRFLILQDNMLLSPDFIMMFARIVESILSNNNVPDNSNVMMECQVPEQLLDFILAERPVLGVQSSGFLGCVSNVFRLLLTRKVAPFAMLASALRTQLKQFQDLDKTYESATTEKGAVLLSRLYLMASMFSSFNKHSLSTTHETRAIIFHYLSNDSEGMQLVGDIFDALHVFSCVIAKYQRTNPHNTAKPDKKDAETTSASTVNPIASTVNPIASTVNPVAESTSFRSIEFLRPPFPGRRNSTSAHANSDINVACHIFRYLSELVEQLARNCNSTRVRRGPDPYSPSISRIPEQLFCGMKNMLDFTNNASEDVPYVQPNVKINLLRYRSAYACNALQVLRKLLFDETRNIYRMMIPVFYNSGCHKAFFELGEVLVRSDGDKSFTSISTWLVLVQKFVTVDAILNPGARPRSERTPMSQNFDLKRYVSVCQRDALKGLGIIFNGAIEVRKNSDDSTWEQSEDSAPNTWSSPMAMDTILGVLKDLIQGIIQLKNQSQPTESIPAESSEENITLLMDMGFTRSQAVEALGLYNSVSEAADYLLGLIERGFAENAHDQPNQVDFEPPNDIGEDQSSGPDIPSSEQIKLDLEEGVDFQKSVKYLCENVIPQCLLILRRDSSIVYSIADLLKVFVHEAEVSDCLGGRILDQVFITKFDQLVSALLDNPNASEEALLFASHTHLICLLWVGFDQSFMEELASRNLYDKAVQLLIKVINADLIDSPILPSLMLWIDLYIKETEMERRVVLFDRFVDGPIQWMYWPDDDRFSTHPFSWKTFPSNCNNIINAAFQSGQSECRIKNGDKNYVIDFTFMTQRCSDRNGFATPIHGQVKLKEGFDMRAFVEEESATKMTSSDRIKVAMPVLKLLEQLNKRTKFASQEVLHSSTALLLRLTTDPSTAESFMKQNGATTIMSIRSNKHAPVMTQVLCLIMRNVVDHSNLTKNSLKCIMKSLQVGEPVCLPELTKPFSSRQRRYQKDWKRVMRLLAPFTDKDLQSYMEVAEGALKCRENDEYEVSELDDTQLATDFKPLENVVDCTVDELARQVDDIISCPHRLLDKCCLIRFLAELSRSYATAADFLIKRSVNGVPFLKYIIECVLLGDGKEADVQLAVKSLFVTLMNVNNTVECNTHIVNVINGALHTLIREAPPMTAVEVIKKSYCEKVSLLARLLALLKECSKVRSGGQIRDQREQHFVRIVDQQNLLVSFTHALWYLPLRESYVTDATNTILRIFEDFARAVGSLASFDKNLKNLTRSNEGGSNAAFSESAIPSTNQEGARPEPASANHGDDVVHGEQESVMDHVMADIDDAEILQFGVFADVANRGDDEFEENPGSPTRSQSSLESSDEEAAAVAANNADQGNNRDDEVGQEQNMSGALNVVGGHDLHYNSSAADEHNVHNEMDGGNEIDVTEGFDGEHEDDTEGDDEDEGDDDEEMETEDETADEDEQSQDQPAFEQDVVDGFMEPQANIFDQVNVADNRNSLLFTSAGHGDLMTASVNLLNDYITNYYRSGDRHVRDMADIFRNGFGARNDPLWRATGSSSNALSNLAGTLNANTLRFDNPLLRRPHTGYVDGGRTRHNSGSRPDNAHVPVSVLERAGNSSSVRTLDVSLEGVVHRTRNRTHQTSRHVHHALRRQGALRGRLHGNSNRINADDMSFFEGQLHNLLNFTEGRTIEFDNSRDAAVERRSAEALVPLLLDRVTDSARLLSPQSANYTSMVAAAYLSEKCKTVSTENMEVTGVQNPEGNEAAPPSAEQRLEEDEGQSAGEASVDSSELSNRFANMIQGEEEESGQQTLTSDNTLQMENDDDSNATENVENSPADLHEPVIASDQAGQPQTDSAMEVEERAAAGNEAASNTEGESDEPQPGPSGLQNNQYRHILGNIEIPEGIDPAFLAALPVDIRQEVIRDHQRQQRLQRISQAQQRQRADSQQEASGEAQNADAASGEGGQAAAEDEVLDQEFLAALPPELQEEVLVQHEQRVAARTRNNEPPRPTDSATDAAAVFESMPPSLRAQVLADADDSVLQVLPENLVAEANRIRQSLETQHAFQISRNLPAAARLGDGWRLREINMDETVASTKDMVQIFDRDSLTTIALLYFMDYDKFVISRFQRLFKVICMHSGTCDFVLRALFGIIQAACDDSTALTDEELAMATGTLSWFNHFQVQSATKIPEQALIVTKEKVIVNKLIRPQVCTRILETIFSLAKQCAANFFPGDLRYANVTERPRHQKPPELREFWQSVRRLIDLIDNPSNKNANFSTEPRDALPDLVDDDFRNSPFGMLLVFATQEPIVSSPILQERVLRIFHTALHSPTLATSKSWQFLSNDPSNRTFFLTYLKKLIIGIMDTVVYDDSFRDCRNFLVQLLYVFPQFRYDVFVILFDVIRGQGLKLADVLHTMKETFNKNGKLIDDYEKDQPSTSKAENVADHPTVAVPQKQNSPKKMLRSLNTASFVRSQLKDMNKRKRQSSSSATAENDFLTPEAEDREEQLLHKLLDDLNPLWLLLSDCLDAMSKASDNRAIMSLQYVAEAFFLAHALTINNAIQNASDVANAQTQEPSETSSMTTQKDMRKNSAIMNEGPTSRFTQHMLNFAEKHRTVLNQILRSSNNNVMEDSAFAVLTYFPKLLDFDVKRKYFYKEIRKLEDRTRFRQDDVAVRIRRNHLFSDSFRELFRLRSQDWKSRFYIIFENEEGQDAGGLLREWYSIITRDVFNPNYALFITAPGDGVTYMVNKLSYVNPEHLDYFKFVGRIIAKAIHDNKQLDCYFTRAFYKHILNLPVRYQDIESEDPEYYKNLKFLLDNPIELAGVDLHFNLEVEEFGVRTWRDLKEDGHKVPVTDENKEEYVNLVCQMKMTGAVRKQLDAFLEGFYEIIPRRLISIFNEQELELLISGLPDIDIDDLYNNTEYKQYTRSSPQIQWFWRALRSFEKEDLAKFLQFVTGTSKVPLQGFAHLEGMNGAQKFTIHMDSRSNDRLPCAHTCFNQLDLPKYDSYEQLRKLLLIAIRECTEGFAFA